MNKIVYLTGMTLLAMRTIHIKPMNRNLRKLFLNRTASLLVRMNSDYPPIDQKAPQTVMIVLGGTVISERVGPSIKAVGDMNLGYEVIMNPFKKVDSSQITRDMMDKYATLFKKLNKDNVICVTGTDSLMDIAAMMEKIIKKGVLVASM